MQREIYRYVAANPGCTRREVAEFLGIKITTITGRVRELMEARELYHLDRKKTAYGRLEWTLTALNPDVKFRKNHPTYGKKYGKALENS